MDSDTYRPKVSKESESYRTEYKKDSNLSSYNSSSDQQKKKGLSSEQMMDNLSLSFDGLFSKIQALKEEPIKKYQPPKQKFDMSKYTFKNMSSTTTNKKIQQKQAPSFTPMTGSVKLPNPKQKQFFQKQASPFSQITGSLRLPQKKQKEKRQAQKQILPFAEITGSMKLPNFKQKKQNQKQKQKQKTVDPSLNFGYSSFQNPFSQDSLRPPQMSQNRSKNAFKVEHLMKIPTMKASINFAGQDFPTRPETSESKLDRVVQQMAERNQKKAIRQSVYIDNQSDLLKQAESEPQRKFTINDFELGKCVGSGKFGDVFICRHKQTGFLFALKKIFKSTILQYDMITQFTRELKIHYRLDHPNIIKLYSHFEDEYHIFLLMEYAEGGILMEKLKCSEQQASKYVEQAVDAVEYLHKHYIAHRDIKPENIVLQFDKVIKLCDFGWSSFYSDQMKTTFCGTLDYLSPQMKEKGVYDNSVDLWSLGVLTFQLLVGSAPYKKQINSWQRQGSKRSDKWNWNINYPPFLSTISQSFMRNLLKQNPEDRSTLRLCSNHMFIRKYFEPIQQNSFYYEFSKIL